VHAVDVHLDDLRVGREAPLPVAEPEVPVDPEGEDDLGLAQGEPAGGGEEIGVVGGKASAAEGIQEHGRLECVRQLGQGLVGVRPPNPGAGEHERALGVLQEARGLGHQVGVPLGPGVGSISLGCSGVRRSG
jgi:hypothetical protein